MRRIFVIVGIAALFAACGKVGQKFGQTSSGSPDAATSSSTGNTANSSAHGTSTTTSSAGSTAATGAASGEAAEKPNPTEAQKAAIAGGDEVKWDQQGITWTLPKGWVKQTVSNNSFTYGSQGGGDLGFLIVNISPMGSDFPTDISLKAFYDQAIDRKKNGEVEEVRWIELDGVKGVMFREAMPEDKEGPRRLQWLSYRKFAGQTQMVNLMLSTKGRSFEKDEDTFYGILYSTKLVH